MTGSDIAPVAVRNLDVLTTSFIEKQCERPYYVRETNQWVRCQSSDPSICKKCASLRSLDKKRIIGSGCNTSELDGITSEMLSGYKFYFATFTAPSFGKVQNGVPVDPKRYEYRKQVEWNQKSTDLFHATTVLLKLHLPDAEFVFVREWQKRGAIHFHGIVRVPEWMNRTEVEKELTSLRTVQSSGIAWGRQQDIQYVTGDPTSTVRYMSKVVAYTSKHQGGKRGSLPEPLAAFYGRLDSHARKLICKSKGCSENKQCKSRMHRTHGYAGQMLSKSKGWSLIDLTFGKLREQRSAYAATMPQDNRQQEELAEAARLAKEAYEAAFENIEPTAVTAGAARLQRALDDALRRQREQSIEHPSNE